MGNFNYRNGLQTGISAETSISGFEENKSVSRKFTCFSKRNRFFKGKKCYRESTLSTMSRRFLQYLIPSSEEKWEVENGNKFETIKCFSEKDTFQDGHNVKSNKSIKTRRLGNFSRSFRCISPCSNFSKSQTVHEILSSKSVLPVESHVFWSNMCSKNFYKTSNCSGSLSQSSEHQISRVFGRLDDSESRQKSVVERSTELPQSFSFSGFHNKQRKIQFDTQSESNLFGRVVSVGQGSGIPNFGENAKTSRVDSENVFAEFNCVRFPTHSRGNGVMCGVNSKCSITHETNTTTFTKFLEADMQRYVSKGSIYTTSEIASFMVEKFSEHAERPIFSVSNKFCYGHDRCFKKRFWGLHWESDFSGRMECFSKTAAYQLSRNEGSIFDNKAFSETTEGQVCVDQKRQHKCCSVYQQTGWNKVTESLLPDLGSMAVSFTKQHHFESNSHCREKECSSRSIKQNKNSTYRMDVEQTGGSTDFSEVGCSPNRSVCIGVEQANTNFLHMVSPSRSSCNRCSDNIMGEHVCLCFSSNMLNTKDIRVYEAIQLPDNTHCAPVATETLVSRSVTNVGCSTNQAANYGESVETTKNGDISSQSSNVEPNSMAPLNRNFQTEGFSESATNLLNASWRKGTQRDYSNKFEKFCSWCDQQQIDPYNASLSQVADFLVHLFDSGLQYRTISGYRSMLSAILPPIGNFQVGQHPHISRLLKGVFHSRPPKVKLLPEWDLDLVLKMLENKPFEPLHEISLKLLTFKTIFLTAITTFRRCSDLQSLRIDRESMKIQEKGITFIRHGLAKQDRQSHFGVKIFVPHFSDKKLLDPKRAIMQYIERTKESRQGLQPIEQVKLFLALNAPHKPVSSVTISKWIVSTIRMAYEDSSLKVKAHSTRAIAPSWALYNGASTKSILDAADWSSESTFAKFYLRDMDVQKVLQ